jgi:hypothetical protein
MNGWLSRFMKDETATADIGYRRIVGLSDSEARDTHRSGSVHLWKRDEPQRNLVKDPVSRNVHSFRRPRNGQAGSEVTRIWSYDTFRGHTTDHRNFYVLTVIDEQTGSCLATRFERSIGSEHVIVALAELFEAHGAPAHVRPLRSSPDITIGVRNWLSQRRGKTTLVEADYRSERAYRDTMTGQLRDWIKSTIFRTPTEAQTLIEAWLIRSCERTSHTA